MYKIINFLYIKRKILLFFILILLLLFVLLFWGPPDLYNFTSTPEYCGSCHVMEYQSIAWFNSVHRTAKCIDCHLPNHNAFSRFFRKGFDGLKDIFFFYGRIYGDRILITSSGKHIIEKNCKKCHEQMVSGINTDGRTCWSCHRRVNHNFPAIGNL